MPSLNMSSAGFLCAAVAFTTLRRTYPDALSVVSWRTTLDPQTTIPERTRTMNTKVPARTSTMAPTKRPFTHIGHEHFSQSALLVRPHPAEHV